MDLEALKRDLKAGQIAPVYLLHGEERYFIEAATAMLEQAIMPGSADFDKYIAYGNDVTRRALLDQLHNLPFIEPRRLVIVREAQLMDDIYDLDTYAARPVPTSVLVLAFSGKKVDKRRKLLDAVKKGGGVAMESEKLADREVLPWVRQAAKAMQVKLAPGADEAMVELIGKEVSLLYPEIVKLAGAIGTGRQAEITDILDLVGVSREYNSFELKNALEAGDKVKTMTIGTRMAEQKGYSIIPLIGLLINYYGGLYAVRALGNPTQDEAAAALGSKSPFVIKKTLAQAKAYTPERLERCLMWLHEYDMKSKGWKNPGRDDKTLTIELLDKLLYAG